MKFDYIGVQNAVAIFCISAILSGPAAYASPDTPIPVTLPGDQDFPSKEQLNSKMIVYNAASPKKNTEEVKSNNPPEPTDSAPDQKPASRKDAKELSGGGIGGVGGLGMIGVVYPAGNNTGSYARQQKHSSNSAVIAGNASGGGNNNNINGGGIGGVAVIEQNGTLAGNSGSNLPGCDTVTQEIVLKGWGQPGCGDVNGDGTTDGADLTIVLGNVPFQGAYGSAIAGDALANTQVGGPVGPKKVFIRFRAGQSSPIVSMRFAFLSSDYPGYGAGTGGLWTLSLYADDGSDEHFPAGDPLMPPQQVPADKISDNGKKIVLAQPYAATAGKIYHFVFENIDQPAINYFSINSWYRRIPEGGQLNPKNPDSDWGIGYYYGGVWTNRKSFSPIAEVMYGNGGYQGMSYGEASYACPTIPGQGTCINQQLVGQIEGPSKTIRQTFTVSGGNKLVSGLGIRLLRQPGAVSDLTVSLRNASDQEIASAIIPASSVAEGPAPTYSYPASWDDVGQNARFVTAAFSQSHTLIEGQTYSLRFSNSQGTYWAWVIRGMTPFYGYSPHTAFADGWSEYSVNGGSTWESLGRVYRESDLQFYLTTLQ